MFHIIHYIKLRKIKIISIQTRIGVVSSTSSLMWWLQYCFQVTTSAYSRTDKPAQASPTRWWGEGRKAKRVLFLRSAWICSGASTRRPLRIWSTLWVIYQNYVCLRIYSFRKSIMICQVFSAKQIRRFLILGHGERSKL